MVRLWHKELIHVLPHQQLVSTWRELSAITYNISSKGYPNHILVNKIMDYPIDHFIQYAYLVREEMKGRYYKPSNLIWLKIVSLKENWTVIEFPDIFNNWHNNDYLIQCFYNLQEKYMCGAIPEQEWTNLEQYCSSKKFYYGG